MKRLLRRYLMLPLQRRELEKCHQEFDSFLEDVSKLYALRLLAERRFHENRCLAKQEKGALPLTWTQVGEVLSPNRKEPRAGIETELANSLPNLLMTLFAHLRRTLLREREKLSLGRVQQVDSACLSWLVKQPGCSVIEKAGSRQQVLGIVRREQFNVLENQVLKDLLLRTERLTDAWLKIFELQFPTHNEIHLVRRLNRLCREGLSLDEFSKISELKDIPCPNYALLQDPLYKDVWHAYLKVVNYAQVIEKLWDEKDNLNHLLKTWYQESSRFEGVRFQSELWILPIAEKKEFSEECPKIINNPPCSYSPKAPNKKDEHIIIDLLGEHLRNVILYPDETIHSNAKPRWIQFASPYVDFELKAESVVRRKRAWRVNDILVEQDQDKLKDYFEQFHGWRGGKFWTVLVSDLWDATFLTKIKHAAESVVGVGNVFLLWRTVAYALGEKNRLLNVQVKRLNGEMDCAKFTYDQGVLCHQSYMYHKHDFDGTAELALTRNEVSLFSPLWNVTQKDKDIFRSLAEGARYVYSCRKNEKVPYYDELMGLYAVHQTHQETIEFLELVKYNPHFPGGKEYVGNWIRDLKLDDTNCLRQYLIESDAEPSRDEPLKLFLTKFEQVVRDQMLHFRASATPGQGVAELEVEFPSLPNRRHKVVLNDLHLEVYKKAIALGPRYVTARILENEIPRSFPPVAPTVVVDPSLKVSFLRLDRQMDDYGKSIDGDTFYAPHYCYPMNVPLPRNKSPLERLRRKNVFGYNLLPQKGFLPDFPSFFNRLAQRAEYEFGRGKYEEAVRLAAWTYQTENQAFNRLRAKAVCGIVKNRQSDPELISLCSNLCDTPEEWKLLLGSCLDYLIQTAQSGRVVGGTHGRIRLLYNLLMFNEDLPRIFLKSSKLKAAGYLPLIRGLAIAYQAASIGSGYATGCLRCLIYLLRMRCYDGGCLARKGSEEYRIIQNICGESLLDTPLIKSLKDNLFRYLNGNGTLEGIATVVQSER